ncbi:sensor histidine kinase [Parablautia muri]|uniref:GHKL domain-containing protein n=1 Tax=Parablautia muri TaxID=2320879 RepID=A0A9X5BDW5_9FIRM|nr:ATP-binding protein [Parablautia muri]NBJ91892.1 GHKL domain-containing protein [Parablautia muri]
MDMSLFFCLGVVLVLMVCLIWILALHQRLRRRYETLVESYKSIQELNGQLRSGRHDYLNHLQVVYGMLELKEYEELHDYLEPIYKDMMKIGKAIRTSIPAVNALLMAKMGTAEAENIDFYVEVKSDLKKLKVEPWELCKVLSNLIDNAITALKEKKKDKKMALEINEERDGYVFVVSDNGPPILEEHKSVIFKQGFTTKQEEGHGMGLYIVAGILKENHGSIQVDSNEDETSFTVKFAKEVKA